MFLQRVLTCDKFQGLSRTESGSGGSNSVGEPAGDAVPDRVRRGPQLEEMVSVPGPRARALLSEEQFHWEIG